MGSARDDIAALIFCYAERMDAGDLSGVGALFARATYRAGDGPTLRGAEAVERVNREFVLLHSDGTPQTKHVTTNLVIQVDEDAGTATARCYFTVFQGAAGRIQPIVMGRYHDRFARDADGWSFSERQIHVDAVGDVSRHLRALPEQLDR